MSQNSRDTPPLPPPPPPAPPVPTPWPLWKAALLSPFRPVGLLKRSDDLTFMGTLWIHWVGLIVGVVVFIELSLWSQSPIGNRNFHPIWDVWNELWFDGSITAGGGGIIVLIDAALLVIGVVLTAWCARDETVWQSAKRSIKRAMLLLPHAGLLVSLIAVPSIAMSRASQLYDRLHPISIPDFEVPPYPLSASPGSPEMLTYEEVLNAAIDAHHEKIHSLHNAGPWYKRYEHSLVRLLWCTGCTWALWVLIVGFSHRRVVYRCRWPTCCEQCGYTLMGLRDDQTCPECGHSVSRSQSWDARPGTAWDRRDQRGTLVAWAASFITSLRPSVVGRQTRLLSADGSHHRLLLSALLLLAPIQVLFLLAIWKVGADADSSLSWTGFMMKWIGISLIFACIWTVIITGSATVVGCLASWYSGRNLLCIAAQGASHLFGLALFWWTLFWVILAFTIANEEAIEAFTRQLGLYPALFVVLVYGPVVLYVMHFWIALWRYTLAARHANW